MIEFIFAVIKFIFWLAVISISIGLVLGIIIRIFAYFSIFMDWIQREKDEV